MATSSTISIPSGFAGLYHLDNITDESRKKTSKLLQENHDTYHVFRHNKGIHNHTAHHVLTLYALGCPPTSIEEHYRRNEPPLRPRKSPETDSDHYPGADSGRYGTYAEALSFFQRKIDEMGMEAVVQEYVLKGDQTADDLFKLLYSDPHSLIHLSFGVEFRQPAIVAEGLAMATVAPSFAEWKYLEAEKLAKSAAGTRPEKTMVQLLEDIRTDPSIVAAKEYSRGPEMNKLYDGPVHRCQEQILRYMSEWRVGPEPGAMEKRLAELVNCCARTTAGAAFHPGKSIKFDFVLIHSPTSWYATYILTNQPWISAAQKTRLVEFLGRYHIANYVLDGTPEIRIYELKRQLHSQQHDPRKAWEDVLRRSTLIEDDGHSSKLARTLAVGEKASRPYERKGGPGFEIVGTDWLGIANMAVESLQPPDVRWVRFGGYEEAWENIRDVAEARVV